ncbi:hypothetical protein KY284_005295 [Solanum tuberosum]|nr:hypothetical protein KY284_005295 [Solanum tuberosum]
MHTHIINEHNEGLDDLVDQEELGGDECDVEEEIDIDCNTKERKEVTFDKGQAVGPTNKRVSEFNNFIGTIAWNPRFINLMYTCWHAVPNDTKKRMWEYINAELQNRQNSGETVDDAFRAVFGKEQHGLRCVGSNLASPVDASSAQAVRGTNLPHSSGLAHNSVLQKFTCHVYDIKRIRLVGISYHSRRTRISVF